MNLTTFGAICPNCDKRYGKPSPKGAAIRICDACFALEMKAPLGRRNGSGGGYSEFYDRRFARIRQREDSP